MVMNIDIYVESELARVPGWCTQDKALKLYECAVGHGAKLVLEIGVYGGSSFFPLSLAMKQTGGTAAGVDPWAVESCLEEMENPANKAWWGSQDLESIYRDFMARLRQYGVHNNIVVHRQKSCDVIDRFEDGSVDILHIDGNHCEKMAYEDSVNFLPKVKVGGHIFFDDVNWTEREGVLSTQKGLDYLLGFCERVDLCGKDCVILRRFR
jgi:predicted O-methyltransferase YrrM